MARPSSGSSPSASEPRGLPVLGDQRQVTVAVVVPTRNEEGAIRQCLRAILQQTLSPAEILVVDAQSDDGTRAVVDQVRRGNPSVRLLDNPGRTIPKALNIGWRESTCDVIVRVDGHAVIDGEYIERAVHHLRTGKWAGVGGRKVPSSNTRFGEAVAAAMGSRWGVGNSRYHYTSVLEEAEHVPFGVYPRATIDALGGWDEGLAVNQDFEFDYRLRREGGRLLFDPSMQSQWACSPSLRALWRQYRRYGCGKTLVALKHPDSVRARHLVPPILVLGTAVVSMAPRRGPLLALAASYAAVLALAGASQRGAPASLRLRLIAAIAVMHWAWGIGFLEGVVRTLAGRPRADPYDGRDLRMAAPVARDG